MQHHRDHTTLVSLLQTQAARLGEKPAYTFLLDGATDEAQLSYMELDRRARAIGALLQRNGAAGERVLLLYQPGLDYIAAFFGCLYAGAVAVPAYPPNPARLERTLPRLLSTVADARPIVALTTAEILAVAEMLAEVAPEFHTLQWFATDTLGDEAAEGWAPSAVDGASLAFLQYTSGSTAAPKGVMLSHDNLLHNSQLIHTAFGTDEGSLGVFWLPFYHDMGLIGGLIQPIYCGGTSVLLSPLDFLQRPLSWLQAISRHRATISGGPNFAYDLCARKVTPEQLAQLDLSSWRLAFNGAEPIRAETIERFCAAFAPCGFRREALYPCYGLAEATLLVAGGPREAPPLAATFDPAALALGEARPAPGDPAARTLVATTDNRRPTTDPHPVRRSSVVAGPASELATDLRKATLVSSGRPLHPVAIVDPASGRPCPAGQVGEIWVAGPSVAQGYWGRPAESEQAFQARPVGDPSAGPFLRTGDLGFLHQGELFVTGRLKDLIIIRGRNHYPQDLELTAERGHPALRPGCGAAFAVEVAGEERLVIVAELERQQRAVDIEEVADAVRQAVARDHELNVYAVALLRAGGIPKTSSGKIQRHACRAAFLDGSLELVGASTLALSDAAPAVALSRAALLEAEPAARRDLLADYLRALLARALRVAPAQIELARPVSALGVDSLMAVELQHTLESELGLVVSMVSFLEDRPLAVVVDELLAQLTAPVAAPPLERAGSAVDAAPATPGQRALWFLHQLAPESAAYTIASAVELHGDLDPAALERSFQLLARRHAALRTTFHMEHGEVVQRIQAEPAHAFTRHDATSSGEAEIEAWLRDAAQRPFDLERGPLWRLDLLRRSPERHVLLLAVHHSVCDLWSLALLAHELGLVYPAERAGMAPELPAPPVGFGDYARWQAGVLAGAEGERLWAFWREQLAGAATTLNLPTDRPRPPVQTANGAVHSFSLDTGLTRRLHALAAAHGTTLYTVLLAGLQALLARYSGQDDILIGTPVAARGRAELTDVVGYFVNPVVIRGDLSGAPSFGELIGRARKASLAAFAHQDYPFVSLAERLGLGRDLSRSPLFQVMFALQKVQARADADLTAFALGAPEGELRIDGLRLTPLPLVQQAAQFDLSLAVGEVGERLAATLEYNSDLFDRATTERMAEHLQILLEAASSAPERRVRDLPLLSAAERRDLLGAWNATAGPTLAPAGVHQLFEAQARRTPEAVAVIAGDAQVSYGELDERASALASQLRGLGVGPETPVGICAERSIAMIVGVLAILKAGGAYLPLDPTYPRERLALMLRQAGATVLLLDEAPAVGAELAEGLELVELSVVTRETSPPSPLSVPERGSRAERGGLAPGETSPPSPRSVPERGSRAERGGGEVRDGGRPSSVVGRPGAEPGAAVAPAQAACIIFTSGSTGQPKGVVLTHDGIGNLIASFLRSYEPGPADRILPLTSLASASFVGEIFPLLCAGGALVLPESIELLDFEALFRLIARHRVSMLSSVPALIAHLNGHAGELPALRLILSGGEALTHGDIDRLLPSTVISNGYGLTETTVCSTFYHVDPRRPGGYIPIGRPLLNTQVYILDEHRQPTPVGVPGELYIGGLGLARGYLGDPALTAERFVPDPFTPGEGGRLYRSGDRARWLADGQIEYVGRLDHQVKLRGFRIELGEIEALLSGHVAVREAVVVARAEPGGERRLVAYITPRPTAEGELAPAALAALLRSHLRERLPGYMLPAAFVSLATMPLTPNGKVDLRALPAPAPVDGDDAAYLAPRSEVERTIAAVWRAALGVERVGLNDSFFDLGGHSLLLVEVHARLRASYPELTLIDLFRHPTVGSLAAHLSATAEASAASAAELQDRAQKQKAFRDRRRELARKR